MRRYFTRPIVIKRKAPVPYIARKAVNVTYVAHAALLKLSQETGYSMTQVIEYLVIHAKVAKP